MRSPRSSSPSMSTWPRNDPGSARPPARRLKTPSGIVRVTVAGPVELVDHLRPIAHLDVDRAGRRSGELERHPRSGRRRRLLADDVADRRLHLVERGAGGRALLAAGLADGIADVLLVEPAVEDPDPHEAPVGVDAGGSEPLGVPVGLVRVLAGRRAGGRSASRKRVSSSTGARSAIDATHASLIRPMSLRTCWNSTGSISTSGVGSPCSIASVPIRWATTALTSQPGSGVGADHDASSRPVSSSSRRPHTSARASTVGALGTMVAMPPSCPHRGGGAVNRRHPDRRPAGRRLRSRRGRRGGRRRPRRRRRRRGDRRPPARPRRAGSR